MGQQCPQEKQRTRLWSSFSQREGSASRTLSSRIVRRVGTGGSGDILSRRTSDGRRQASDFGPPASGFRLSASGFGLQVRDGRGLRSELNPSVAGGGFPVGD